jgi:Phosphoenolpyruvate-dependent sugar phosphotransferase system, EIIA 2
LLRRALGVASPPERHGYQGIPLAERYAHRCAGFGQNSFSAGTGSSSSGQPQFGPERIAAEILKREELGSTGTGGGVAIPHARIQELNEPFGIFARLNRPIDFQAIDTRPVDLVFLLLLPGDPVGEQLKALATVARKLRDPIHCGICAPLPALPGSTRQ